MPCLTSVLAVPMGATGTLQKAASLNSFSGRGVSDGAFAGGWKLLDAAARSLLLLDVLLAAHKLARRGPLLRH